jgi:hypothetical protein
MGWKVSALIISSLYTKSVPEITVDLGLGASIVADELPLSRALYPNNLCIGFHDGHTIVTHAAILNDFFTAVPGRIERRICEMFPEDEIIILGNIENAAIDGFSFIKGGSRVRLLLRGEDGIIIEEGAAFEQEQNVAEFDLAFEIPRLFFNHRLDYNQFLSTKMYKLTKE